MNGNPFQFAAPVTADALVGRGDEQRRLLDLAESGTFVMLEAPRRFGKTSLLKSCAQQWRADGGLAVWVDFSRVLTADEAALRVERALEDDLGSWQDVVGELLRSVRLRLGPLEFGRPAASPGRAERLHELLEVAARAARQRERRSLVCFDEFQDVLAVPGLDGTIRSHVQHHADHVSYVFSGSEPSLLRSLFTDRARPLYAQAKPMRLGPIETAQLAGYVTARFTAVGVRAGDAVEEIVRVAEGHPQRTVLLAWHLWDRAAKGAALGSASGHEAIASAIDDSLPELEAVWRSLAANERRVAAAIALGLTPFSNAARRQTGLASASAAQRAMQRLTESGLVDRDRMRLTDPLLGVWLRREHG